MSSQKKKNSYVMLPCVGSLSSTELRLVSSRTELIWQLVVSVGRINDLLTASLPPGLVDPYVWVRVVLVYSEEQLPVRSRSSTVSSPPLSL